MASTILQRQPGIYPPPHSFALWPKAGYGHLIHKFIDPHNNTPQLVGLLWISDQLIKEMESIIRHLLYKQKEWILDQKI